MKKIKNIENIAGDAQKLTEIKRELLSDEGFNLTFRRSLAVNPDGNVALLDYILGNSFIIGKKVPLDVMAKVMIAVMYHAKIAYTLCTQKLNFKSLDQELLNNPNSEKSTHRLLVETFPDGMTYDTKLFFII